MTFPSFSIICPVYNMGEYISSAIDSVLKQTYPHFELIVIDDCSTDHSISVVKSFTDSRIHISSVPYKNGKAGYFARNYGVSLASNKWICFLDADDIYLPNHLSCLSQLILDFPDQNYFCTNFCLSTNQSYQFISNVQQYLNKPLHLPLDKCIDSLSEGKEFFHTNSVCISKPLFDQSNGFPSYNNSCRCSGDGALFLRLAILNKGIILSPVISSVYRRICPNSTTKSFTPLESNCFYNSLASYSCLSNSLQKKLRQVLMRKSSSTLLRQTIDHKLLPDYIFRSLRYTGFNIRSLLSFSISLYNFLLFYLLPQP